MTNSLSPRENKSRRHTMTAPNWLINVLIKLKLKTSEEELLLRDIATSEERLRSLNHEADQLVTEIKQLEALYRETKNEYDNLKGIAQETLGIRLENLLETRDSISKRNTIIKKKLQAERIIHDSLLVKLELTKDPIRDASEFQNIKDENGILTDVLNEGTQAAEELKQTTLIDKPEKPNNSNNNLYSQSKQEVNYDDVMKNFN
jgi:hypothetical protein